MRGAVVVFRCLGVLAGLVVTSASALSAAESPPASQDSEPGSGRAAPQPPVTLGGAGSAILIFSAGGGTASRVFRYYDGRSPQLRTYDLTAAPDLAVAAEIYPLARLAVPVLRGFGFSGAFEHALDLSSQTSSGTRVGTNWQRAEGDLRLRFAFGEDLADEARFVFGLHGGVVKETFSFNGDASLVASLPDVDYLFGRAGADGRLRLGPIALMAGASYLPAISGGEFADRFRGTSFAAVEFGGGLAVPMVPRIFELRANADYTRVFYAFHPIPGDPYVAGGALDHLVRVRVLATLLL